MTMRRILAAALAVFVFCITGPVATTAQAQMVAGQSAPVLVSGKRDLYPGAAVALDFAALRGAKTYKSGGVIASTLTGLPGVSVTRSTGGYAEQQNGALVWFNSGQPRITDKGLLVEEGRANLLLQSARMDTATWSKVSGATVTLVAGAPDGSATVARVTGGGITSSRIQQSAAVTAASVYSGSVFLAYDTAATARVAIFDGGVGTQIAAVTINWTGGVPSLGTINGSFAVAPSLAPMGSTGIWRLSYGVNSGAFTSLATLLYPDYVAGTGSTKFWGAQLELGDVTTSYIPTGATAVTRAADDIFLTTSAAASTSHTMVFQGVQPQRSASLTQRVGGLGTAAGDNNNRQHFVLASTDFQGTTTIGGTSGSYGLTTPVVASGSRYAIGMRRSGSTFSLALDGVFSSSTNFTNAGTGTFEGIRIGRDAGSNPLYANGYIERVLLYTTGLSDTQFAAITSPVDPSSLRLDFASGSYKNSAGYVRTNLLTQSQALATSPWTATSVTATNNVAVAPDGTSTATRLTATGADSYIVQGTTGLSGQTRTFAVWLKTASGSLTLNIGIGTAYQSVTVTSSWQRFWVTNASAIDRVIIGGVSSFSTGQEMYAWGAQLTVTGYPSSDIPTAATPVSVTTYSSTNPADIGNMTFTRASTGYAEDAQGNLVLFGSNVPRITSKGVLIEPAATNLLLRSQEFDIAPWAKTNAATTVVVTANAALGPDGTATAARVWENTTTTGPYDVAQQVTAGNGTYTFSAYFKAAERGYAHIRFTDLTTGDGLVVFNLTTGAATVYASGPGSWTAISAGSTPAAGGYYRCWVTATKGAGAAMGIAFGPHNGSGSAFYAGVVGQGVYIAGTQVEGGSVATSYIPTISAQATRAADVFYYSGVSVPASFSVAMTGIIPTVAPGQFYHLAGLDAGSGNDAALGYFYNGGASVAIDVNSGGVTQANLGTAGRTPGNVGTIALSVAPNSFGAAFDSTLSTRDTAGSVPTSPTILRIGQSAAGNHYRSYAQRIALFPYAANDNELPYRAAGNF